MDHEPPPNTPENFKAHGVISNEHRQFKLVAKIYVPKSVYEQPKVYIFPSSEQFGVLPYLRGNISFHTSLGDPPDTEIIGENLWVSGGSMRHWDEGLEEAYLQIYPSTLIVRKLGLSFETEQILFRLTDSLLLSPNDLRRFSFDGTAELTPGDKFRFSIAPTSDTTFEYHYMWDSIERNKSLTYPHLVAHTQLDTRAEGQNPIEHVSNMDDFLLIVSFAEGKKCAAPKYEIQAYSSFSEIYRMDRAIPTPSEQHSFNDFLIDHSHFDLYCTTAWNSFTTSPEKAHIRTALQTLTNDTVETLESRFLGVFSSIETLLLVFRVSNHLEFIVDDKATWRRLKRKLKQTLKGSEELGGDPGAISTISQNLEGLNRIPLSIAFDYFLSRHGADVSKLWPLSLTDQGCSLKNIRDKLVHGYGLQEKYIESFGVALDNLELYAKQMMLLTLGWSPRNSRAGFVDERFVASWRNATDSMQDWVSIT